MRKLPYKEIPEVRKKFLSKQKGLCPVCKTKIQDPCLDHSHVTGAIRDVLCRNCNGLEGRVFNLARRGKREGTEEEFLQSILRYWRKHKNNRTGLLHPKHGARKRRRKKKNVRKK